jgi:simple sugar transport system ATP-binding protein
MADEGKAIVFISHKLDEVMAFSDRVTVLRDGKNVATVEIEDTDKGALARLMVGREVIFHIDKEAPSYGETVLGIEGVSAENDRWLPALINVSLKIRSSEILGIAGVAGNGQRELAEVVTGLRNTTDGQIFILNDEMTNKAPIDFIKLGVAHVPGDRLGMGLAGNLPLSDNLIMKAFRKEPIARGPLLDNSAAVEFSRQVVESFNVETPSVNTPARNLSGGNQQKAILGREIFSEKQKEGETTPLLVAVYPTRGLDVGAIESVRESLMEQQNSGTAILLISEDLEELMALSDRIAVLHGGEVMGIVKPGDANIEQLGLMMAGERRE